MNKIFLLAQYNSQELNPSVFNCISAAKKLSDNITVLIAGENCKSVAEQAAKIAGVKQVLCADNVAYKHVLAENIAALIAALANDYTHVLAPANTFGKNILPRVSGLLDWPMISDVTEIHDDHTFSRPIYAGNAFIKVKVNVNNMLLTIRATAFESDISEQSAAPITIINTIEDLKLSEFIKLEAHQSIRPDLTTADIVISGGRGLQSKENFAMLERIADKLHAAVGASRAAVDAGFVPNDYQVGQTGKIVAPKLYIAVGISGAIQHLAGMKDSKIIVAINKDPDAPIFQVADYGLVGDLFKVLPELEEKL